jgi:adenylate cyclase
VAQKLNVSTILEGSVRKFGKRVRITVQLVEVATDSHLWSETYDRELEDIFGVQDDIAQSVVKELRSALLGEQRDSSATAGVKAEV